MFSTWTSTSMCKSCCSTSQRLVKGLHIADGKRQCWNLSRVLPRSRQYFWWFIQYRWWWTKRALEQIMCSFIDVTERQLVDFLPGVYMAQSPMQHWGIKCHFNLTNLLSENEFGNLDFSYFKRRGATLFNHSGIQMVKRNKTISSWLASKSSAEQCALLKMAQTKSHELHNSNKTQEGNVLKIYQGILENVILTNRKSRK